MCAHTAFVALENIENFNKGALRYGVPELALFQSIDLHEGHKGPLLNVINCINKLGFVVRLSMFSECQPKKSLWHDIYDVYMHSSYNCIMFLVNSDTL